MPARNGAIVDGGAAGNSPAVEAAEEGRARQVLSSVLSLTPGDLVIHADHGLGRFSGLVSVDVEGREDLFEIEYRDGKLLVPVREAGLVSRFGSGAAAVGLDRLGGTSWSTRKGRAVRRIGAIAKRLIGIAAARAVATAPVLKAEPKSYRRFCKGFPFAATPDQDAAIDHVIADLQSGRPMDRLVCGDVGSGKTEVALRAAFIAAAAGVQVAVVVPTTILARQHTETFQERFRKFPIPIEHDSRLTTGSKVRALQQKLAAGETCIVVGTHALLSKSVAFANLGLLIVDEEQRFGVKHKERLKQLREGVHVLTLTATPIPRTMQMALSPVRELSLIMTPPLGRKPVLTDVGPADPKEIARRLMAERARGGQSFFVCPRIADLEGARTLVAEHAPEIKAEVAHGQMSADELDRIMEAFTHRRFDVLISTTIVESGLDVPSANTLIVHDAHRLGLAQLYQLRGRVGRSPVQANALLTYPPDQDIGDTAGRRLEVLKSLDSVGAGFAVASHDMDIRGAGNVLGEEQSGHIREIGFELFETLLARAVEAYRRGESADFADLWVPRISLGLEARIPAGYVADAAERIAFYWRIARAADEPSLDAIVSELEERHGALPAAALNLLASVRIGLEAHASRIAEIQAGPKGAVISLRPGLKPDRRVLVAVAEMFGSVRIKRDRRIVVQARWTDPEARLAGVRALVDLFSPAEHRPALATVAAKAEPAAAMA
jgi:transcription-repair coupling factor (superfamily II helicase)